MVSIIHAHCCKTWQSAVPLVLLPRATEVFCFTLQQSFFISSIRPELRCIGGYTTYNMCDNCCPCITSAGACNAIIDDTFCSQHRIVWPTLCLRNVFCFLERVLCSNWWNTARGENPEHTFLDCTKKKWVCKYYILQCLACWKSNNKYYLINRCCSENWVLYITPRERNYSCVFSNSTVTVLSSNSTYQQSFTRTNKH